MALRALCTFSRIAISGDVGFFEPLIVMRGRRLFLAKVPPPFDPFATEGLLGPELIVGSASDTKVLRFVGSADRLGLGMIELEEGARFAATPVLGNVGTLRAVALEDFATHGRADTRCAGGASRLRIPRPLGSTKALSLEVQQQKVHGALDDDAEVAARVGVTHEVPTELEFSA